MRTLSVTYSYEQSVHTHNVDMDTMGVSKPTEYMYIINSHKTNIVRLLTMMAEFQKIRGPQQKGRVLSLVVMNPEQILTRPGHIFNLRPLHQH